MSKIRRKVTVENTKTISDSTSRRPSVFERLGPSTGSTAERSPERTTEDLRERMKNKHQDVDTESQK